MAMIFLLFWTDRFVPGSGTGMARAICAIPVPDLARVWHGPLVPYLGVWHEGTVWHEGYGTRALCQGMARGMARSAVPYPGTGSDRAVGAIPLKKNRCHIRIFSFGESSFAAFLPFFSRKELDMQNPVGKIFA